jgi:hypothetical protein
VLQACLAVDIDAASRTIAVGNSYLPDWLDRVSLRRLSIGSGSASLNFHRQHGAVEVAIADVEGDVRLVRNV